MKKLGREFLQSRAFKISVLGCLVVSMMVCTAFAEEVTGGTTIDAGAITTAFTSGFQTMVTNCIAMISAMVPIAVTLGGLVFMVGKAMKWFKSIAK